MRRRLQPYVSQVPRDDETGSMGINIDEWEGLVTVGGISAGAPAVGRLIIGDVIEGVNGKDCHNVLNEVSTRQQSVVSSSDHLNLFSEVRWACALIVGQSARM